jgi:hypothetical protein
MPGQGQTGDALHWTEGTREQKSKRDVWIEHTTRDTEESPSRCKESKSHAMSQ